MEGDITVVSKSLPSKYVTFSSIQQYFKYSIALFGSLLFRIKNFIRITEECETVNMDLRALLPPESDSFCSQHNSSLVLMISDKSKNAFCFRFFFKPRRLAFKF